MKTIIIAPNETFEIKIQIKGVTVATQHVYMISEGLIKTRGISFYPIQSTEEIFESAISHLKD